jgi:hypothetical protein
MSAPILLVHLFTTSALNRILSRLADGERPDGTEVYLGTYSANTGHATAIAALGDPSIRYAPTIHLSPDDNVAVRGGRQLPPADLAKLDQAHNGPFPADPREPRLPATNVNGRDWGIELGRRFRDELRKQQRAFGAQGLEIAGWQLDEIYGQCKDSARFRQFTGGVIQGIAGGRPELEDEPLPGFVWMAWSALSALAGAQATAELKQFWTDVDAGARCLIGEEYPTFDRGMAQAQGIEKAKPQNRLGAATSIQPCKSLAKKYVVGMNPGWQTHTAKGKLNGLGGNLGGLSPAEVADWRKAFVESRTNAAKTKPVGYAEFSFLNSNITPPIRIDGAIDALHVAATVHTPLVGAVA